MEWQHIEKTSEGNFQCKLKTLEEKVVPGGCESKGRRNDLENKVEV